MVGIDPHEPSIQEAKTNSASKGLNNLTYQVASGENYQGKFDIILFLIVFMIWVIQLAP